MNINLSEVKRWNPNYSPNAGNILMSLCINTSRNYGLSAKKKNYHFTYTAIQLAVPYYHHFDPKQPHLMQGQSQLFYFKGGLQKNENENIINEFGEVKWWYLMNFI